MVKRIKLDGPSAAPSGEATSAVEAKTIATGNEPKIESQVEPKLEIAATDTPKSEAIEVPAPVAKSIEAPRLDMDRSIIAVAAAPLPPKAEVSKAETAKVHALKPPVPKLDWIKPLMAEDGPMPSNAMPSNALPPNAMPSNENSGSQKSSSEAAAALADREASARGSKFALLAASVAIAAGIGAMAGAFGASGLALFETAPSQAAALPTTSDDARALQTAIAQLRSDLAALKISVEASTKASNGQFAKISERFDRVERAQAEPIAKVTKAIEALERRAEVTPAKETTGSVPTSQPAVAAAPTPPAAVAGWVVRDVRRGVALVQAPRLGLIEIEAGDVVPGIGRVDSIRKQDGRWVVTTSRGLITSR
jgi:hypothetical protein